MPGSRGILTSVTSTNGHEVAWPDPPATAGAPSIGEGVYDYATGRWSWDETMYGVLGLPQDGRDPEQLVFERMHPEDRPRVRAALDAAIEAAGPFSGQYRVTDASGRERAIAFVGDAEPAEDGRPVRLRGHAFDVTPEVRLAATEAVAAATQDRAAIEQLKGALMLTYGLDADTAFGVLSQWSQRGNVRVAELARHAAAALESVGPEDDRRRSLIDVLDAAVVAAGGRSVRVPDHRTGDRPGSGRT
jgi:hypothetical protein